MKPKRQSTSGFENAKKLFLQAGLAFPKLPDELAGQLEKRQEWLYSTRNIAISPYDLQHYVREATRGPVDNYVILSHSGHGVNSYAIQYYLVWNGLRMFLFLGWGGVYMDSKADAAKIRHCFALADKIASEVQKTEKYSVGQSTKDRCIGFLWRFLVGSWAKRRRQTLGIGELFG